MSWQKLIDSATDIRRQLHMVPEPCWKEHKTFAAIAGRLGQLGISWRKCAKTGIVAYVAQGGDGDHVALRADMDGLVLEEATDVPWKSRHPGYMHGCGHDGHIAVMLAAAEWLKKNEADLPGPVSFIFQPAEEGGYGAREMIADGALEGVDRIFGWHNWPSIPFGKAVCPPGPTMAANGAFRIIIEGKGGHASQPEICRDPILAAAAVTLGLQQIVSRRLAPQQAGVLSVTSIEGSSMETVIPDRVELSGSVRAESTDTLQIIADFMESTAASIAAGYNTIAELEFNFRYPAVVNEPGQACLLQAELAEVLGETWLDSAIQLPIMASEDFSYYLEQVPGAYAFVGAGDGGLHSIGRHNSSYDFNDNLIEPMVRVLVKLAGLAVP